MTWLVTGGTGQVATALAARAPNQVTLVGRPEFDFDHPATIAKAFHAARPSLVINAAAWTAVDAAEAEPLAAMRANLDGPAALAALCAAARIPLITISTDYVFDGSKGAPYTEDDATCPTGVYGASKLAGEQAALAVWDQVVVLRTSWVYAATGKNFVRTMLAAGLKNPVLRVVADQIGCPTNAGDLADAILTVEGHVAAGWRATYRGVFNAAGTGSTSWHGLAIAAFQDAAHHNRPMPTVTPILTADWPTPARRPADSRLDCGKLEQVFGVRLPEWHGSLTRTVNEITG